MSLEACGRSHLPETRSRKHSDQLNRLVSRCPASGASLHESDFAVRAQTQAFTVTGVRVSMQARRVPAWLRVLSAPQIPGPPGPRLGPAPSRCRDLSSTCALANVVHVEGIEIDEGADTAFVRVSGDEVSERHVEAAIDAASEGSGHTYRIRAGSWGG